MDLALVASNKPDVWTSDIEAVLDNIRINAYIMSEVHRKQFLQLKNFSNYFDIPVIVISAVNTIISVGVQAFLPQPTISITNCVLSATCGIIVSVKLYLAIQTQMELELSTSKDFYTLSTNIYKTISLNAPNRGVDGIVFLHLFSFQTLFYLFFVLFCFILVKVCFLIVLLRLLNKYLIFGNFLFLVLYIFFICCKLYLLIKINGFKVLSSFSTT